MKFEKIFENKNLEFGENFKKNINHCFKHKENIVSDGIYYYYHSIGVIDFVVFYNEDNKNIQIILKNEFNSIYHFDNQSSGLFIYSVDKPIQKYIDFFEVQDHNDKLYTNIDTGSSLFNTLFNNSKIKFRTNEEDHFYNLFKSFSGLSLLDNEHLSFSKYDKAFLEIDDSFEKTILALLLSSNEYFIDIEDHILWENFLFKRNQIHYISAFRFEQDIVDDQIHKKLNEDFKIIFNNIQYYKKNTFALCYDLNPLYDKNKIFAVNLNNEKLCLNKPENILSSLIEISKEEISSEIIKSIDNYIHKDLNSILLIDSQEFFNFYEIQSNSYLDIKFIYYFNMADQKFNFKYKNKSYFDYIEKMNRIYFDKIIEDEDIENIKKSYKNIFFIYQKFYIENVHNLQEEKKGIFFKFKLSKYKNLVNNIISNLSSFKK